MNPSSVFTVEAIRDGAIQKVGHSDFGSDSFLAGLEPLLYSIEHEAALTPTARDEMWDRIVTALANRLTLVAWETAHPELAAAPIDAPLVILGLPRTGSTILHETLAASRELRATMTWEVRDLALAAEVTDARADERVQGIAADIERTNELAPGYAAIHRSDAYVPMECVALTILDLVSIQFATIAWAPTYREFLVSVDPTSAYDWHQRALRYLQAGKPQRRWILKAPMHALYIDALIGAYPDAMLIHTHRDPEAVCGSLCSLYATLRRARTEQEPDVEAQARADVAYTAEATRRVTGFRAAHPERSAQFCDVAFERFMADPGSTLDAIHDHFGLELAATSRVEMLRYLANRPRDKYGTHSYSLDQFGLTRGDVEREFEGYIADFGSFL